MIQSFSHRQMLNCTIGEAWEYFCNPVNLNEITPDNMVFKIISDLPDKIYPGLIIRYRLTPILGISVNWCTEITHVQAPNYFVDEQRFGPYKFWHHQHHFTEVDGKVLMEDIVHYDVGKWIFGQWAGKLFVENKLKQIFDFRRQKLKLLFGD